MDNQPNLKQLSELKGPAYASALADVRRRSQAEQDMLRPDDPRLRGGVHLIHRDNSILHLKSAFSRAEGDWVFVFTANHGALAYLKDELVACHDDGEPADAAAAKLRHDDSSHAQADPNREGASSVGFGDMPISTGRLS
jgi:hypothetical protein